eukprot:38010_1
MAGNFSVKAVYIYMLLLITLTFGADRPNILFLMCDSMDGRNVDPTAPQSALMNLPNLRNLAKKGSTLIRHYTSSPQCVPGRTTLFSGRRIDQSGGYNNAMGWGLTSDGKAVDPECERMYNKKTCKRFGNLQIYNLTVYEAMKNIGYNVYLYGKVDVGGGIIYSSANNSHFDNQTNGDDPGFHGGPINGIPKETRSANIQKPSKSIPTYNESVSDVKASDFKRINSCIDKLNEIKQANSSKPWFLYCSVHIPHPPYQTNSTWLQHVAVNDIPLPKWLPESQFHPADKYQSISKDIWQNFTDTDINNIRATYYAMNVETDYMMGSVINAAYLNGWNESNTMIIFTSDHGDMAMEHRQVLKNSMYEASTRIPMLFAGPNIYKNKVINNITASIDILPTLIEFGGGDVPSFLSGYSLTNMLQLDKNDGINIVTDKKHPSYITSQYHSNQGNTGSFMVRKGKWKYIQFGHYLKAYSDYKPQLFDVKNDPSELNDVSLANPDIVKDLETILSNEYNYEYVDCIAKHNDFTLFEEFQWNLYNQSALMSRLQLAYTGFDENDWETIVDWRNELLNATNTTCEDHATKWLRPIREEERRQWYL